ncbi:MAG: cyclic-di-AMP receptor [Anaerolineales bacterium]|nr:cyclic-di-AMP receptor [Anaerolineales bacterium]
MKLIICILQDSDKDSVADALIGQDFRVTVLPSTGAYFRRGNTTLMVGTEDERVDLVIDTIRENCAEPAEPSMKRATLFVLNVDRFEQV